MASIVFTAPRHLDPNIVIKWTELFIPNRLHKLHEGEFVYVCNRNHVLFRAKYKKTAWLEKKIP